MYQVKLLVEEVLNSKLLVYMDPNPVSLQVVTRFIQWIFLSVGVKSLVNVCLSVIVRSEEVMSVVPSLPPKSQTQINAAYKAHKDGPQVLDFYCN